MHNNFPNPERQPVNLHIWLTYLFVRNSQNIHDPQTKTGSRAFSISGPVLWNVMPVPIRNAETTLKFRKLLISKFFDLVFPP